MTKDEVEAGVTQIFADVRQTLTRKGQDYGGDEDVLANLKHHGIRGVIIRLFDKLYRLENVTEKGTAVISEPFTDTCRDIIGYAALIILLHREEERRTMTFTNNSSIGMPSSEYDLARYQTLYNNKRPRSKNKPRKRR